MPWITGLACLTLVALALLGDRVQGWPSSPRIENIVVFGDSYTGKSAIFALGIVVNPPT